MHISRRYAQTKLCQTSQSPQIWKQMGNGRIGRILATVPKFIQQQKQRSQRFRSQLYNNVYSPPLWSQLQIMDVINYLLRNIFSFMKNNAKHYSHQVFTIIDKILSEKMRNCEEFYSDLVDICLELVHPEETKTSNEALKALKTVL